MDFSLESSDGKLGISSMLNFETSCPRAVKKLKLKNIKITKHLNIFIFDYLFFKLNLHVFANKKYKFFLNISFNEEKKSKSKIDS